VTGVAQVRLPPDRVSFSVGVDSQAPDVAQAFADNRAKLDAVVLALRQKGVQPKELQTSNLDVSSRDHEGKPLPGFRVSSLVTVTRADPASAGDLLQAAVSAGANQAGGLTFSVGDPASVQSRGLELAFQDARHKAETLAKLAGRTLGAAHRIEETQSFRASGLENNYVLDRTDAALATGTEQIGFSLHVVFELR
jgi:uncharacterized protein YggE